MRLRLRECFLLLSLALLSTAVASARAETRLTGDLPRRAAHGFSVTSASGALAVRSVGEDAPAAAAGLREGDRLVAANGEPLAPPREGRERLRLLPGGEPLRLEVERDGARMELRFTPPPLPLEETPGVDTTYGVVDVAPGVRLRSVVTRPAGATGALPAIFLAQWVSCDGVEPLGTSAWDEVVRGLIARSGAAVLRVDRSSGGDSRGPACHELDHDTELAHYGAAFDALVDAPGIDRDRVVIFGMSLGGTTAPLLAQERDVAGVIVSGGGALTYYERMLAFDRIGWERSGTPPDEVDALVRRSAELHVEYLLRGRDPEAIAADLPHLAGHWERIRGTGDGVHYGRPYDWHRQLARRDLMAAWSRVEAPVLNVYGTFDQFEPPFAFERIARTVNRVRPGTATAVAVPGMSHFYRVFASREAAAADAPGHDAAELAVAPMLEWLRDVVGIAPRARDATPLREARRSRG